VVFSTAVLLVVGAGVGAWATYPSTADVYTGCLTTSGSGAGQISKVAIGSSPLKPCSSTQHVVNLSGGTITSVTAGPGLTGGGSNGAVTIGLASGYALPQTCSNGELVGQADGQFTCYGAGVGLVADQFDQQLFVAPSYRLPQNCDSPSFLSYDNGWKCVRDPTQALSSHQTDHVFLPDFNDVTVVGLDLPAGHWVVWGKASVVNRDTDDQNASCSLRGAQGGLFDMSEARIGDIDVLPPDTNANEQVIPVMGLVAGPIRVLLTCSTNNGEAKFGELVAVAVA
jgi:hypothetical protein